MSTDDKIKKVREQLEHQRTRIQEIKDTPEGWEFIQKEIGAPGQETLLCWVEDGVLYINGLAENKTFRRMISDITFVLKCPCRMWFGGTCNG